MVERGNRSRVVVSRRRRQGFLALLAVATAFLPLSPGAADEESRDDQPGIVEVDRLHVPTLPGVNPRRSGWLILNPTTRRAYQIFEASDGPSTYIHSFDLDTMAPRRQIVLSGYPIPTGRRDGHLNVGSTTTSADVMHAVDEEEGIIYLALGDNSPINQGVGNVVAQNSVSPDARRLAARYVAIDERALDAGRDAVSSFKEPPAHAHLRTYWLHGMEVDRSRLTEAPSGRKVGSLILLFAQPNNPQAPVHNHEIVRWDVSDRLTPSSGALNAAGPADFAATREDGRRVLDACRSSTLTGGTGFNPSGSGAQWELLVREDELFFACQSGASSAAVGRLDLEDDGGFPPAGAMSLYILGKPAYDAVVDRGDGRMFLRTTGTDGETWWVFDVDIRRFTGSLAAKVANNGSMVTGVDRSTGRLYMLLADYTITFGTRRVPVQGGLQFADTRLFSPVPFENIRPDLAYPAMFRIQVDPKTRRIFVRRGISATSCTTYPGTGDTSACPSEPFYRVLKDSVPVPDEPAEADDAAFTTAVEEKEGITRASFLGTGSGYGVRTLLVGGFAGATAGIAANSPCGKDDRRILSGSVGPISVSDLSTAAVAASLDADIGTQKMMAAPLSSCIPDWPGGADSSELSFDKRDNGRPSQKRPDGVNDYEASCVGEGSQKPPPVDGTLRRDGFTAEVRCHHTRSEAVGKATGELTLGLPPAPDGTPRDVAMQYDVLRKAWDDQTGGIRVAKGHSELSVTRTMGTGILTRVDSWARGIVIPGVGEIGAVRAEARVQAAGTPGTARSKFERTICDVDFGNLQHLGCLDLEKDDIVKRLNEAAPGVVEFRVRNTDPKLEKGSASGYQAAVQRDRLDRFGDRIISRDDSLAVPALEVVFYQGAAGRQILQLAGAEASVSYGIACLYGQKPDGKCAAPDESFGFPEESTSTVGSDGEVITVYEQGDGGGDGSSAAAASASSGSKEPRIIRLIKKIPELVADAFRLIFSNPREFALMAAVWALLYAPCYLGERRRTIRALRARRALIQRA